MASIPLLGFGTSRGVTGDHVRPMSLDVANSTLPAPLLRQTRPSVRSDSRRNDGWIALKSLSFSGPLLSQVRPPSRLHSTCKRQPSCSVLLGERIVPPASSIGLFLI